jgi:hypothetical protein
MEFRAKINRISHVWQEWTGAGRLRASLCDVVFEKQKNGDYTAGPLQVDEVVKMDAHPYVIVESTAAPVPGAAEIAEDELLAEAAHETFHGNPAAESQPFAGLKAPESKAPPSLDQVLRPVTRQQGKKHKGGRR